MSFTLVDICAADFPPTVATVLLVVGPVTSPVKVIVDDTVSACAPKAVVIAALVADNLLLNVV